MPMFGIKYNKENIMLSIWISCAVLNVIIIGMRQLQEPVSKNALVSAVVRNAILGPVSTIGLVLSGIGIFHRQMN